MRLVAEGIEKAFGTTRALASVSLSVREGSVHALLGENGAGKSTLMKILSGSLRPDRGTLALDGEPFRPADPLAARRAGVAIVHQELSICPHMSVAENVLLGAEDSRLGFVSQKSGLSRVERALALITRGGDRRIDPFARAGSLSAAEQQLVEIARALSHEGCRLLILDEPTSSLGVDDAERLFDAIRGFCERGIAVVYISHFLEEVRRIAEDYTVLCDGRSVAAGKVADTTNEELVVAMAGRAVGARARAARTRGEPLLRLHELSGEVLPKRASLELCRGEVLGLAGLLGSGRTELLRAVFGLDRVKSGEVRVAAYSGVASPRERLRQGVGLLSEDRAGEGLALERSIAENLTLSKLGPLARHGFLSLERERNTVAEFVKRLSIRCRDGAQAVRELSGGNQQKVALARLLYHDADVLLLDEPTRGIDVRSRAEIHATIHELAAAGKAVLVVSSHLDELIAVCDRIAVMHRGVLSPARPASERNEHELLLEAAGA
jgi:ribose transport system ATP-binding protein